MSGIPAGAGSLLGKRLGKYEILALLALGGTAEIYLARIDGAAGFEKYVVVKCLHDHLNDDQDFVKMFLDEARIAAQLDHSNIVQTTELGEHDGRYYMVMEFLAGLSLAMAVRRVVERVPGGRVPTALSLNMLAQAAGGLHYAHERAVNGKNLNIVHRDISPQNLVVSFEGVVKVVDFGIAKADQRETKTRSGTIKGKFAYMSPEQCVAQNVDRRTDVFALGVIAHELLTGKRLFKRPSPYETYQAVIDCAVTPPSKINHELDPALDAVVMRALAKDKDQRYPTAEAFGDALIGYLHTRGKGSGPGDVARFFEAHFTQEIEEHGARMRELIGGRESVDGMSWGEEEEVAREADHKRRETVDLTPAAAAAAMRRGGGGGEKEMELGTMDLLRPSASSLSSVIDDLGVQTGDRNYDSAFDDSDGDGGGDDDDGGMPADRTRIEANPLELLAEMDRQKAPAASVRPATAPVVAAPIPSLRGGVGQARVGVTPVPAATVVAPVTRPANTPVPVATVIAPQAPASARPPGLASPNRGLPPISQPPPQQMRSVPAIRSGRLSQSMPLSTSTPAAGVPASNPSSGTMPPPMGAPASGALPLPPAPQPSARGSAGVPVGNGKFLAPAQLPTMIAELDESSNTGPGSNAPRRPGTEVGTAFDESPATMEPGLSPTAFDGETYVAPGANQQPQMQQPYPQQQQYDPNGYPMMTSGGYQSPPQPFASQQLPAGLGGPGGYAPHTPASGAYLSPAASMMSPVGAQYPNQVDWNAAANKPARALKPWMMGVLFAGAIGLALLLTVIIAKIAHHH